MQLKAINGIIALACATKALQRPRVIIAPAQFGVPKDYDDLSALLRQRGHTVACAPLSRLSWLRIVPSVFTEAFFKGELKPRGTLDFFFEALDAHPSRKRAKCSREALLAHFVLAVQQLQMIGFVKLSKRSRGMLQKMVA